MTQGIDDGTLLADCETRTWRFVTSREPGALDSALAAFAAVPAHLPQRPRLAGR